VEPDEEEAFEEEKVPHAPDEKVWRYAKKPLLRIGSKGATHAHGNSLRQLLDDHTVVKVKVNTKTFGTCCQKRNGGSANKPILRTDSLTHSPCWRDISILRFRNVGKCLYQLA
jgi:hypothetical protein